MVFNAKNAVYNGGPFQSYWWADEHEPIHPAIRVSLKDPINEDMIKEAWEKLKGHYPLIDCIADDYDEEILFFKGEGESVPIKTDHIPRIAGEAIKNRGFVLTFFENTLTLSAYHSLADEIGLMHLVSELLTAYFTKKNRGETGSQTDEVSARPEEYFVQNTMLSPTDFKPQTLVLYHDIANIFMDPKTGNDEKGINTGSLIFPAGSFEKICDKYNISADEMMILVMAKAVHRLFPEERRALSFGVMTDFRGTFDMKKTIAPCSKRMPLVLEYEDVIQREEHLAKQIAEKRAIQTSDDYIKSHVALENSYAVLNIRNVCTNINYAGCLNIGEFTSEICGVSVSDYSANTLFLVKSGERIYVSMQYGKETDRYMTAARNVLTELGINDIYRGKAYRIEGEH
ncbi:MAG: hypothetical protein K5877_09360 [Lachnospiraceae bacterium]|nr:hypothetical protein [Lachnospiraceae bacterium]